MYTAMKYRALHFLENQGSYTCIRKSTTGYMHNAFEEGLAKGFVLMVVHQQVNMI